MIQRKNPSTLVEGSSIEYENNILKEEYKEELENYFVFIKKSNNIDEERSSYYFNKNQETNQYELVYHIYLKNDEKFIYENKEFDKFLQEIAIYNIQNNYTK